MAEPVRYLIRQALMERLLAIRQDAGYRLTMKRVYDMPISYDAIELFPAAIMNWGDETVLTKEIGANRPILDLLWPVTITVVIQDVSNRLQMCDYALADIQQMIGKYYYLPGAEQSRTAFVVLYRSAQQWTASVADMPLSGIAVGLDIHYRIRIDDPTQQT